MSSTTAPPLSPQLQDLRVSYELHELNDADAPADPYALFRGWLEDAIHHQLPEPNAMTLSTLGLDGSPNARNVLLKQLDERGFSFFTNYESRKAAELAAHPRAALTFLWTVRQRQVTIRGTINKLPHQEAENYFALRPYGHQIGAWASTQSTVIPDRHWLEQRTHELEQQYPKGTTIPCPPHWGGYVMEPDKIEFWQGRRSRLHDRILYELADGQWTKQRLSP
jgi:pyridoxamine 5'-phosphate oxidase